jgi:excinuclease ABC subunit A
MLGFFHEVKLTEWEEEVAGRLLYEIRNRLSIMQRIGLGYLTLERVSSTLSGGETQRIHLTRTLGSNLTNSLYILDEPSIGLHPKDTEKLVEVLKKLRDLGNTVVVVEHEETVIRQADHIVDIGPGAGSHGGHVVYSGSLEDFLGQENDSLTRAYLTGEKSIEKPAMVRNFSRKIMLKGARQHNLKGIDVTIPLECMTVISGVSGSGKSTLVNHLLFPALKNQIEEYSGLKPGVFDALEGDVKRITQVEMVDQQAIGKSSRSNPVTYVKAFDSIRDMMAGQQLSRIRGYKAKDFSFNVEGGRCETCKGDGEITVEMQFLADVKLICDDCKGYRFKQEILEVEYRGKNIYQILDLTIEDALVFFNDHHDIARKLKPLEDVGLGYVKLGQSSSTLSGGEAQRLKLASFLARESAREQILFIFDEPTTGLHFHDVGMLLAALNALVDRGHTVVVVEHNLDVIKSADWVIDLGPDGGREGGHLVYEGPPEGITQVAASYTGHFLREK